jgi:hypothetical protein
MPKLKKIGKIVIVKLRKQMSNMLDPAYPTSLIQVLHYLPALITKTLNNINTTK